MSALIYGKPGVGKTVLAGSAAWDARSSPVVIVDAEEGYLPLSYIPADKLQIFPLKDFSTDLNRLLEWVESLTEDEPGEFKTVVLDSLTEVSYQMMTSILRSPSRRSASDTPEFPDWNLWTAKMRTVIDIFRDAPIHIIMTTLESEDDSGRVEAMFDGKKLASTLAGKFDIVGRMVVANVPSPDGKSMVPERRLMLRHDSRFVAKDRTDIVGTLPPYLVNPTVTMLLDRVADGQAAAQIATKGK